ncbi:hypothetical protein [Leptolyngbya sp. GGD]|uniref:hypothetical protein n=1 Tax=Leptolyngbya sp. GGD TaxID=2997907 RepID=UPI00227C18C8|nr:hypothetical protein [Leptolyngbya sp. GGD]MCY6493143.1 hypothetical protein [Leptolyngbya sp. GGD]
MKLDLAIDRGNGSVKWFAHLEDGRNYCGKFASMILQNRGKADPISVDGVEWLYGATVGSVGLDLAIRPSESGAQGKVDHFPVVLAGVLQELMKLGNVGHELEIENLSIVSPVCNPTLKATYETALKGRKFALKGKQLKLKIKSVEVFPEASIVLKKSSADIVVDVGYGTVLGSVRGVDGYSALLENGSERLLTKVLNHPKFVASIDAQEGKSVPQVELLALTLAKGATSIRGVDLLPLLSEIVPQWFDENAIALLPKLRRIAKEEGLSRGCLLIGGGVELLKLALGDSAVPWATARGCILTETSDFASVQTLGELWAVKSPVAVGGR